MKLDLETLMSFQTVKEQKSSDWYKTRQHKVGASEIQEILQLKYNTLDKLIFRKIHNDFVNNIYTSFGSLFEKAVHAFMKQLNTSLSPVDNQGMFAFENSVFSPDALCVIDNVIHIFEYKSPFKRKTKDLLKHYYHQLNYSAYVIEQILKSNNYEYGKDYVIKCHFLACRFKVCDSQLKTYVNLSTDKCEALPSDVEVQILSNDIIDQIQDHVPLDETKDYIMQRKHNDSYLEYYVKNYEYKCFDPDRTIYDKYKQTVDNFID